MKLFCLLITQVCNSEVLNPRIPIVSNDVRVAQKALREFAEDEKYIYRDKLEDGSWVIEADEDGWFEIYEDGFYPDNHVLALIIERNLDELDWGC